MDDDVTIYSQHRRVTTAKINVIDNERNAYEHNEHFIVKTFQLALVNTPRSNPTNYQSSHPPFPFHCSSASKTLRGPSGLLESPVLWILEEGAQSAVGEGPRTWAIGRASSEGRD